VRLADSGDGQSVWVLESDVLEEVNQVFSGEGPSTSGARTRLACSPPDAAGDTCCDERQASEMISFTSSASVAGQDRNGEWSLSIHTVLSALAAICSCADTLRI
jgi:hypothetical protein